VNSTQLHYRESVRALQLADQRPPGTRGDAEDVSLLLEAVAHGLLAATVALQELTRQADPGLEAVAQATGVLHSADNVIRHHAFNAFGSDR
jgi:hypothetical protein